MSAIIKLLSKFDDSGIKKAKSGFSGLGKTIGALGIGLGLGSLVSFAKTATQGFEQAQIASSKLANVMKSMGVSEATKRVDAYAESLQNLTAVDADVIKAAQTKLATFANLNKTINIAGGAFDRATVAALDLAAAGFGSAESNAVQLGKALNDPIKGLTALTRSGITFTAKEKDKIKTLVATNKTLEAQDLILKAIEKQVGGTAAAGASVFDRMKLSMDTVSDSIGEILLPHLENFVTYLVNDVVPNVQQFFKDVANPKTDIGQAFAAFGDTVKVAQTNLEAFFAMMDPKKQGNAMSGFAASLEWIAITLSSIIDGFAVLVGVMDKLGKGDFVEAGALLGARTDIGAMAVRNKMTVEDTIKQINARTKAKGSGMFITDSQGGLSGVQDKVLFGAPGAKIPKTPSFIKPNQTNNNVTINVQGGDPKVIVDALGKYIKANGSLPFAFTNGKARR
jgi:hypothetical protein